MARQPSLWGGPCLASLACATAVFTLQGIAEMLIFRWLAMLLLLAAAVSFAFYAGTGQARYKRLGLVILKWTVIAAVFFFAVILIGRLA
jgi:predicted exporter